LNVKEISTKIGLRGSNEMEQIPIVVLKNGDLLQVFSNLQETHRYLKGIVPYNDNQLYTIINHGIDDGEKWIHNNDFYEFKTNKEIREKRADRKTRV
jgi:hypothetical protein